MPRYSKISPEQLNAYVDGELSGAESAAIARAAANSPAVAAQIATLREMKAALADFAPDSELVLPAVARAGRVQARLVTAAATAMLVIVGGLYWLTLNEDAGKQWARAFQLRHTAWTFPAPDGDIPSVRARAVASILPPDLGAARLTFAGREDFVIGGRRVHRIGYEGTRGCRVSLFVFPRDVELDREAFTRSLLVRSWGIGDFGFALMADGMNAKRFDSIALAVEKALRSGLELDRRTRQQLAQARRTSPPCQA